MKRLYIFICLLLASKASLFAQLSGTVTVGATGTYPDLTSGSGLFNAINTQGLNGNLFVNIVSDITEPGTISLNQRTEFGGPFLLTIRPNTNVMRTITGSVGSGSALIRFTGADRVIIDGRDPSNSTFDYTNRYLTFSNTHENADIDAGAGVVPAGEGIVFSFSGGAIDNSLRSLIIEGSDYNVNRGVVVFGGGGTIGNNNIVIEYCDIKNSNYRPSNGLYSSGSSLTIPNQNNIIRNNRFYDFFFGSVVNFGRGIFLSTNNDNWTIENNSIYQTSSISSTANKDIYGIHITSAGTFYINNNYIGGDSPLAEITSNPWTSSNSSNYIRSRLLWVDPGAGNTVTAEISGNTITNISSSNTSSSADILLAGIYTNNCNCTIEDNFIGAKTDGTGNITVSDDNVGGTVSGIITAGTQPVTIQRNTIQNFSVTSTASAPSTSVLFRGINIDVTSSTYSTVLKNIIVKNSVTSKPATVQNIFSGINCGTSGVKANITKNQIGSLTDNTLANTVSLSACITCPASYEINGINVNTTNNASLVDKNKIGYINISGATTVDHMVAGIHAGANVSTVQRNTICNLTSSSDYTSIAGIQIGSSSTNLSVVNNMITLGNSITADVKIYGIHNNANNTSTLSVWANSSVITGTSSGGNTDETLSFYRDATSPVNLSTNIFFNNRTGGGNHYAIGTSSSSNFTSASSDYNLLYSNNSSTTGLISSTAYDFATWQTLVDANSKFSDLGTVASAPNGKFVSLTDGDLRIPEDGSVVVDNNIVDQGAAVVTEDIDGAQRLNIPDIGASEVLITWQGGTSGSETDWFTASNWSGSVIPSCGVRDRIKIRNTTYQPVISSAVTVKELVIIEDASVTLTGSGSLDQCSDGISPYGIVVNGMLTVSGSQFITLIGNFTQNNTFNPGTGTLIFNGSNTQQLLGDDQYEVYNLVIDGGSAKSVSQNVVVDNVMTFTNGIVNTVSAGHIIFGTSGSHTGASDASHISGPAGKQTNSISSFTFPVGKNGILRPLSIAASNTPLTTFTAEYFPVSALTTYGSSQDGTLQTISDEEYWILSRSGITDASVTLTWNATSGVSANAGSPGRADLRVIRWDGSRWVNHSGNSITGTQSSGSVTSDLITAFSPFTLGSEDPANPLPVNLKSFQAYVVGNRVKLVWTTTSESKNDYFTIENSKTGEVFQGLLKVAGNGNTISEHTYIAWDNNPYSGLSYYRLRQTDWDGLSKTFKPVSVQIDEASSKPSLSLSPNPVQDDEFSVSLQSFGNSKNIQLTIIDMSGYELASKEIVTDEQGEAEISFTNEFPNGVYIVKACNGVRSVAQKIVLAR
ncbi:MAG TPA: T9SS type A sorting domain-containing protein [Ohtaekwangia sp.]|uniref:beta strand repeat-containing protein n=1 Tax=Ohtaekwangia sp. TaxID=2066019 RepID=UPI002F949136